jgi:hypothetical protein
VELWVFVYVWVCDLRQATGEKHGLLPALVVRDPCDVVEGKFRPVCVEVLLNIVEGKQPINVLVVQYARIVVQIECSLGYVGGDEKPSFAFISWLNGGEFSDTKTLSPFR